MLDSYVQPLIRLPWPEAKTRANNYVRMLYGANHLQQVRQESTALSNKLYRAAERLKEEAFTDVSHLCLSAFPKKELVLTVLASVVAGHIDGSGKQTFYTVYTPDSLTTCANGTHSIATLQNTRTFYLCTSNAPESAKNTMVKMLFVCPACRRQSIERAALQLEANNSHRFKSMMPLV